MGIIPNITEKYKQETLDYTEATLRANLRDAERDMSQAGDELMLAEERFKIAREVYWAVVKTLDKFTDRKLIS